ncbi:MAG: RNA polymerase sigma factor [Prevotella sp.]|nr:RNA polymerase sigma factor [Prevotella sp.]
MIDIAEAFTIHSKRLFYFILGRVRTADDAKDILQEIFLRLIVNSRENDISQVSAWLYRTARNHIIDRKRKHDEMTFSDLLEDEAEELTDLLMDNGCSQNKDMVRRIVWEQLYEALEELPKEQQQAFIETELKGLSYREMSEKTGISIKTLLSRKHYAVMHLRSRLRDIYNDLLYDDD